MSLQKQKDDWEELANIDPLYAIISDPTKKFGKWNLEEFFLTGEKEIDILIEYIEKFGIPKAKKKSLDHGCGVGRLTRALSKYFIVAYGVDISSTMIEKANDLNKNYNCKFVVNDGESLPFPDDFFDLIYSNLVLMHMPNRTIIKSNISEFIRTIKKDGLIIFQLPSGYSIRGRLQPRRYLYTILRFFGVSADFLYKKVNLNPIRMDYIHENEMRDFLKSKGVKILDIQRIDDKNVKHRFYYLQKK